jgi:HEAT repeat protein
MSEKLDIEGLIKALAYEKDSYVRREVAKAVGKIGDSRAVEPLINALNDSESRVRSGATTSLAKIGEPAFEPLINALNDSNSEVRCAAAKALGEIGDSRAVETLTKALDDTCVDVGTSAKEALHKIGINRGCCMV